MEKRVNIYPHKPHPVELACSACHTLSPGVDGWTANGQWVLSSSRNNTWKLEASKDLHDAEWSGTDVVTMLRDFVRHGVPKSSLDVTSASHLCMYLGSQSCSCKLK